MINFQDPNQTTHDGKTIPINTREKYVKGQLILKALYNIVGVPWTQESENNYEARVLNGQTMGEIIHNTYDEYLDRMTNTPGSDTPEAQPKK